MDRPRKPATGDATLGDPCGDDGEPGFVDDLIARGEAAEADADGNLPDGATHEVVVDEDGRRRAVRRRFFGLPDV